MTTWDEFVKDQYVPHDGQQQFHESGARFRLLVTGRRFGKTMAGANETWDMCKRYPGTEILVTAPEYSTLKRFDLPALKRAIPKEKIAKINISDMTIELKDGTLIYLIATNKNYDAIRGGGYSFVWMDEAALTIKTAWDEAIRPAIGDKQAEVIFTTTPKPLSWLQELFDTEDSNHEMFHFGTKDNPYFPEEELEEMRAKMPEDVYRQEVLGEWLDDIGEVFKNIRRCVMGGFDKPAMSDTYVAGVDLGKKRDWTVIDIIRQRDNHTVFWDRWQNEDWDITIERLANKIKEYNNAIVELDATGLGDVVLDMLRVKHLRISANVFDNKLKVNLIQNLQVCIEQRLHTFPEIPIAINEMRIFKRKIQPSGLIKYSAPEGYHDDCVIAKALACKGIRPGRMGQPARKPRLGGRFGFGGKRQVGAQYRRRR